MLRVNSFGYNGVFVSLESDKCMLYTAKFVRWTDDPGIGLFECSDGKNRLIPSCALIEPEGKSRKELMDMLPKQTYEEGKVMFGTPNSS